MAKEETPKPPQEEPKPPSKQEQKRQAVQQEATNNQKAAARNQSIDLLDSIAAQSAMKREDHIKAQNAVQILRVTSLELSAFEKAVVPAPTKEEAEEE